MSLKKIPLITIIGRPNVGKSSLFNTLLQRKKSLVAAIPGVTRDLVEAVHTDTDLGYQADLVDTGGISYNIEHDFINDTIHFAKQSMAKADLILFVVDVKEGITHDDMILAELLRKTKLSQTILVVNKVDNTNNELEAFDFYQLGFDSIIFVSCAHRLGIRDLKEKIQDFFITQGFDMSHMNLDDPSISEEENDAKETDISIIKCALLGKPNAGKSSFFNRVIGEGKAIVSNIAGTTRDVLTEEIIYKDSIYRFADMAGLRRRTKIIDPLEQDSIKKALWAIRQSDIVILLIDASLREITEQDKKLLSLAIKEKKAIIIGFNKWDLIEKEDRAMLLDRFEHQLPMAKFYPMIAFSTKEGKSIYRILDMAKEVAKNYHHKIKAKELTLFLKDKVKEKPPFSKFGVLKIFYGAQVGKTPPTFEIFVNNQAIITTAYKQFLMKSLYEQFPLKGVPLLLTFKNRH